VDGWEKVEFLGFPKRDIFDSLLPIWEIGMLTQMTEEDWSIILKVFDASKSKRGEPGHDDRNFLEAILFFVTHNITWRALPERFGKWNTIWKRFYRLSRSGVFEIFFYLLAASSETAGFVQMLDSTTIRAHVSAAGAKGGKKIKHSAAPKAALPQKFM
jgi:transposase